VRLLPRPLAMALAAAALLAPAALRAQDPPPRDTIVVVGDSAAAGDTIILVAPEDSAAARRRGRWAQPFAVRASGRVAPRRPDREVVWMHPDSLRRLRADSIRTDSLPGDAPPSDSSVAAAADSSAEEDSVTATLMETLRRPPVRAPARDSASREPSRRPGPTTPGARPRTHRVAAGETFFGIARRYGVTTAQLRALNPDVDWERLEVGVVLRLPAGARAPVQPPVRPADPPARPAARPAAPPTGRRTHTVAQGETLFGIARRYGVTVDAIRAANDLEGDGLRVGQRLVIPRAAAPR